MKLSKIFIFLSLFVLTLSSAYAAKELPLNIGVYGGANINMLTPDFKYPDTSFSHNSIDFKDMATDFGFNGGLIANFPINKTFTFSARLGYNGLGGTMETTLDDGSEYSLDASMHYFEISPVMQFHNLLPLDDLYLLAGLEFDFPLSASYTLTDKDTELPVNGAGDADMDNLNFRSALALGVGYTFEIADNVFLAPEVSYRLPFTQVSADDKFNTWSIPQLRVGINLTFGLTANKKAAKDAFLNVNIDQIRYYDKAGDTYPIDKVVVEEVQYTEVFPFIPYVFFEANNPTPSEKHQNLTWESETGPFSVNKLEPDAMKINMSTLDIIGSRLQANPNEKITITGTNDGKEEAGDVDLSRERAQFIKGYLVEYYGINPDNITVKGQGLPDKPSSSKVEEGREENRRAEFLASSAIMEPIVIEGQSQSIAAPNFIEFIPIVESSDSVTSWEFNIHQAGVQVRDFSGKGIPESLQWVIYPNEMKSSELPLEYQLKVVNESDLVREVSGTIPVEYLSITRKKEEQKPDKVISKFSLVLFDFDNAEVSESDMKIIEKYVLPAIKYNSIVEVYGYTDRIGDESYNQKLAERRAKAVEKAIKSKTKAASFNSKGVGENHILFDNNLPIGRHLSRTVQIYVETPK